MKMAADGMSAAARVNRALEIYIVLMLWVTIGSWIKYLLRPTFDTRPLFGQYDQFRDLTNYAAKTAHLRGGAAALGRGFPIYNYPPPGAFVFKMLIHSFPSHAVGSYLACFAVCVVAFAIVAWRAGGANRATRASAAAAIGGTALLGYPMWFTADRGNTEWVVWALAGSGLCFLLRGKYRIAAVMIGLAASIKPFCILFLLLLLGRRRYKEAALGAISACLMIFAATMVLGSNPWKVYRDLKPGATYYMDHYVMNLMPVDEARFGHSLLDGMKSAALSVEMGGVHPTVALSEVPRLMAEPGGWHAVRPLVHAYSFIVTAGFVLLIAVFYRMPILNQLTALGAAVALCPPVAGDYTLLQLYVPFGALLVFLTRDVATGKAPFPQVPMLALATIYALLFSPLTFLRIYAGDAKLLLLLALLVVAARSPMHSSYFCDAGGSFAEGETAKLRFQCHNLNLGS